MTPADPSPLAAAVAAILESEGIPYVIGGSVAASIYGEPRSTLDVDVMIDAGEEPVRRLVHRLEQEFHVDQESAVDAVKRRGTFNAIHLASSMKVDFFIAEDDRAREQIKRRRLVDVGGRRLFFYAPEDIVIRKLAWFRMGGEVSDRQWRDILGILRLTPVDREYLQRASVAYGVADLLDRAWLELR